MKLAYCVYCQESPGGDDLRASAAKVLFGVSGRQAGGPKRQTGGAPGQDESAGADQEDAAAGAGEPAAGGEATGSRDTRQNPLD